LLCGKVSLLVQVGNVVSLSHAVLGGWRDGRQPSSGFRQKQK
jgi:hypothetical protein